MMHLRLIGTYALVLGGGLAGLLIGIFVAEVEPAVIGWVFGAGSGLMIGSFVAAIASNEPLVGRGALPQPPMFEAPRSEDERAELENGR